MTSPPDLPAPEALSEQAAARLRSGEAWADFCATLRDAGDIVAREAGSDLERAEGYRYLTRLLRNSLERFVENSEPYRPRVLDPPWRVSIAIQSPDQDHPLIEIDGRHAYRIHGTRGTVGYASFLALACDTLPDDVGAEPAAHPAIGDLGRFDPTAYRPTGFLSVHDLDVDDDGRFEIVCSTAEHPGNWLRLEPESTFVMIRQTYVDRERETPMTLRVERIDPEPVRPVRPDEVARNLAVAAQNVVGTASRFLGWAKELARDPNTLVRIDTEYTRSGGSPDHLMYFGSWELAPGEALLVEALLPPNDAWNFQTCSWWAENFDSYEDGGGYLTKRNATVGPDGRLVMIVSPEPLDHPNRIDTFGHARGTMNLRIVHPDGEATVATRVVRVVDLDSELDVDPEPSPDPALDGSAGSPAGPDGDRG